MCSHFQRHLLTIVLFVQGCVQGGSFLAYRLSGAELTLVSWNVENLFHPAADAEHPWSVRFSPEGAARWTESRYRIKINHLATAIARMQPDILCLQEVESPRVLLDLQRRLRTRHGVRLPYSLHRHGTDFRGMDVAMLSRVPPLSVQWISPVPGRRDIQVAEFRVDGASLTVINNHWKSRFVPQEDDPIQGRKSNRALRLREARVLRNYVDSRLRDEPAAALVVVGDFNDDPEDESLVAGARILMDRAAVARCDGGLYNLAAEFSPEARGTFYYRWGGVWNAFDTMAVSRGMLPEVRSGASPWKVRPSGYAIVRHAFLTDAEHRPLAFRRIRRAEDARIVFQYGYSDHLPVRLVLQRR